MKILQLCNKVPYPPKDGGAIAILNLSLAFVNQGHEVTLLAINTPKHSVTINQIPDSYSSKIKFKLIDVNTNINPLKMAYNLLFSTSPYIADRFISDDLRNSLIEILSAEIYDIVQVEGLYVTPYIDLIRKFSNARISYRAHNIEHVIWSRISKSEKNLLKKVYTRILARRLKRMEFKLINRYDLLVPITEKDSVFFKENGNSKPLYIVSGGIDEASFIISSSKKKPSSIFFIGALDWMPNQEGLVWFIDKVWTKLNNEDAALEFHVAGRNAPNWLINRLKESNIYFHGEIEDSAFLIKKQDLRKG